MSTSVFLFSDIDGSTRLWAAHAELMGEALRRHDAIFQVAIAEAGGQLFKHTGDGVAARFDSAGAALTAAVAAQRGLAATDWGPIGALRARIGLHAGEAQQRDGDWFGQVLNRTARLMAVGHGGQVLASAAVEALLRDGGAGDVGLVDVGWHRLRDLAEPEHVFEVTAAGLSSGFPPLRSLDAARTNLPEALSSFLGRRADVADVTASIGRHRLVTLTGPGGVGKTRLALQVGAELTSGKTDGVWLAELATLADPEAVDHAVLAALGFVVRPGMTPRRALVEALAERELTLVLDNCEHLLAAVAALVAEVLAAAPGVRVLATSREPLAVVGEHVWAVEPLPLETDAVDLFVERAGAARRGFTLGPATRVVVEEICRGLDGVPLAIELAAARSRSMTPEDLRSRLGERFRLLSGSRPGISGRQATLLATLDWSYGLLRPDEQAIFDRLSVFAGGFDVAAALAVAAEPDADELDVLDLLGALIDKSMVRLARDEGGARYALLDTMRHYGAQHVAARGEDTALARRHGQYYAALAERAGRGLRGPDEAAWAEALDADFDNLRAAVGWAVAHCVLDVALSIPAALWSHPIDRMVLEPADWAEAALALPGAEDHPLAPDAHITAGYGAQQSGRYRDAMSHGTAAVALAEAAGLPAPWLALGVAGSGAVYQGHHDEADALLSRIMPLVRAGGDDWAISRAQWFETFRRRMQDPDTDVEDELREMLARAERVGSPTLVARAHFMCGVAASRRDPVAAARHHARCEQWAQLVGGRYLVGSALAYRAVAVAASDPLGGLKELLRALDWHHRTASPMGITQASLRDLFPAMLHCERPDLVILLDAHLPPLVMVDQSAADAAATRAAQVLGEREAERLRRRAVDLRDADLIVLLQREIGATIDGQTSTDPRPEAPEREPQ